MFFYVHFTRNNAKNKKSRPCADGQTHPTDDPLMAIDDSGAPVSHDGKRVSLSELSRRGSSSVWSKAIDADVARTFGRPTSFRGNGDGTAWRRESRRRHWWPESLGGAPLGAMTPLDEQV